MNPILLEPNQLHRFYRGGARIAELRGTDAGDPYAPEEWIGSTTPVFGSNTMGISLLPDDTPLPEAIAARPEDFLGSDHVRRFGADPRVLVKLLDAGERLPVHLHPDRAFARSHLGSEFGKTEAWVIVAAEPGAAVHVGFTRDIERRTLRSWVEDQATASMLEALHEVAVKPGDVIYVPAGAPHAIGEGILMIELQEPSDLSILLEWEGFEIDGPVEGHLGLGFDVALEAVDRSAWDEHRRARLRATRAGGGGRPGVEPLFAVEADRFFRAERIHPGPTELLAAYSLLIVLAGEGALEHAAGEMRLGRGDAVLVPFGAGDCRVSGELDLLRCLPPDPSA